MILSDKNFISVSYKKEARKILKTHYGKAVLVSFLVICIVQGFSAFEIGMVHQTEASTLYKNTAVVNEKIKMFWRKSRIRCFWLVKCIFMRYNTHTS